jgi:hypothetical protein
MVEAVIKMIARLVARRIERGLPLIRFALRKKASGMGRGGNADIIGAVSSKPTSLRRRLVCAVGLCLIAGIGAWSRAEDHILTIGGGSSASNNQVSLEKNVLYLQHFLADRGLGLLPHEILFSDGMAGGRDLQYVEARDDVPRVNELLGEIFRLQDGLDTHYRSHAIPHLWGPSGRQSINRWFDTIGAKLHDGDRLLIYYTGHGGRGRMGHDTTLAMWNEPDMPVKEFVKLLDRLPPKVSVVLVMVQCFSGGFADVIFNDADPSKGLSSRNRCGFFATTSDRVAAGCTADVDEENYREYSTYFWAALYGRKRTGEAVPPPDFNQDGHVSFAEAHAYSLINSDTIDVSNKTSDAFLKQYSKFKTNDSGADLLDANTDYAQLLQKAEPPEHAVLEGLSQRLTLTGADRATAARNMSEGLRQRRRLLQGEQRRLNQSHDQLCQVMQAIVKRRWPELTNLLNPGVPKLLNDEGKAIVKAIESSSQYPELQKEDGRLNDLEEELTELERKQVKCMRFIRTAEHVALAANLSSVAPPEVCARYAKLIAAEGGSFAETAK